ncbi:alpha/beta hydrolase family protein [Labedaea rhizosphaerae]|nr:lipase family protein [Labedaea rhizosphaerae]
MRKTLITAVALGAGLAVVGAPAATAAPRPGTLVAATALDRLDAAGVTAVLADGGADTSQVRTGVRTYRLTYRTVGVQGEPTTATGLVIVPQRHSRVVPTVVHTHGTLARKDYAPSTELDSLAGIASLYYAAAGNFVVAPDYLGLGQGPGTHPYGHLPTEVSASLDMLRAAGEFARDQHLTVDRRVAVTGFSQGGRVAMGLAKQVQAGADRFWRLRGVAPVSGPYDLRGAEIPAAFDGRLDGYSANYYLSYVAIAWNRITPLYATASEVFKAPYDAFVPGLFDGTKDVEDIVPQLPATPEELFTEEWIDRLRHPSGALRGLIDGGDTTCDWHPHVPVLMMAASGDRDVTIANSRHCVNQLRAAGLGVHLTDFGAQVDHFGSAKAALPRTLAWLRTI